MRFRLQVAAACLAAVACSATAAQPHLQTAKEKFSYAIGLSLGNQLRQGGITDIDPASLALAVQDLLAGVPPRLTMDEMKQAQADYRKALVDEQRQVAARNLKSGNDFLAANGKKDGVITLDSGVQYKVIKAGEGSSPNIDDSVVAHYRGTRLDGRQFDSSYDRGEPLTFALKGVITGWQQVVTRMSPGGIVDAWIPATHAYGENAPPAIGPNSALYFRIELVGVQETESAAKAATGEKKQ